MIGLEEPKLRFHVLNTALQLGILSEILKARERATKDPNGSLKGQLALFQQCIEEGYEAISKTLLPEEQSKYSMLIDPKSSNILKITIPGSENIITISFSNTSTMLEIIERAATKQQYLQGDEISSNIVMNLFSYALYIDNDQNDQNNSDQNENNFYKGFCIRYHYQTLGEYNLSGTVNARIGLLPINLIINLSNVKPKNPNLVSNYTDVNKKQREISISPDFEINYVINKLKGKYKTIDDESDDVNYGFHYSIGDNWLDGSKCWNFYNIQNTNENSLLFMPRYRPIRVKCGKEIKEVDWLDFNITIQQMLIQLTKKFSISKEIQNDYGLFLFPLPNAECTDKTVLIVSERGWKEEENSPGTHELSFDISFYDIILNFPKRNFILNLEKRPNYLSVSIQLDNYPKQEKRILAYYDIPVRNVLKMIHKIFNIDSSFHCSLAVKSENRFVPLRKQSTLRVSFFAIFIELFY